MKLVKSVWNSSTLSVTAPANPNLAPPGHYMLFVVSNTGLWGVPSEGKYIQLVPTP